MCHEHKLHLYSLRRDTETHNCRSYYQQPINLCISASSIPFVPYIEEHICIKFICSSIWPRKKYVCYFREGVRGQLFKQFYTVCEWEQSYHWLINIFLTVLNESYVFLHVGRKKKLSTLFSSHPDFASWMLILVLTFEITKIKRTCVMPPAVVASFGQVTNHFYFII